jgi:hypothetical protein
MSTALRSALLAMACSLALPAWAQEPSNQGVKSTATVEVLEDTAHVDEVISRLKEQPDTKPTDLTTKATLNQPAVQSLKAERPDLSTEVAEQEKRGQAAKDDKHGGWRWQRVQEERSRHIRKTHAP